METNNNTIKIDVSGLEPEVESFMMKILKQLQDPPNVQIAVDMESPITFKEMCKKLSISKTQLQRGSK